jgi:hypothetical protein
MILDKEGYNRMYKQGIKKLLSYDETFIVAWTLFEGKYGK